MNLPSGVQRIQVRKSLDRDAVMCVLSYTYKGNRYELRDENGLEVVLVTHTEIIRDPNPPSGQIVERRINELVAKLKKFGLMDLS